MPKYKIRSVFIILDIIAFLYITVYFLVLVCKAYLPSICIRDSLVLILFHIALCPLYYPVLSFCSDKMQLCLDSVALKEKMDMAFFHGLRQGHCFFILYGKVCVSPTVPDIYCSCTIIAGRDSSLKIKVFYRMVFCLHRESNL